MSWILNRLNAYWREILFCGKAARNWSSRYRLLRNTARFHLFNALGGTDAHGRGAFSVDLDIAGSGAARVTLRPFAGDLFILYEILAFGVYQIPASQLPPEDVRVIVDCGASIGIASLYFAARYPRARIFSVEPLPENFALLQANVAHQPRVTPIMACITAVAQPTVRFTVDRPAWGNRMSDSGISVPAVTIGELCQRQELDRIDLLKVDIEGAEEQVFAHGGFLSRVRHVIVELHGEYSFERFQKDIAPSGFVAQVPCRLRWSDLVQAVRAAQARPPTSDS